MKKLPPLLFLLLLLGVGFSTENRFVVENQEITEVAKMLARLTGKNLVIDPRVKGKISIYAEGGLSDDDLWRIFSTGLNQLGFTIRFDPRTNAVQIVPLSLARALPPSEEGRYGGEFVLGLIKLNNLSAKETAPLIKPLLSSRGSAAAVGKNLLVIRDYAASVSLVARTLRELDSPSSRRELKVYSVSSAADFEKGLRALVDSWVAEGNPRPYYAPISDRGFVVVAPLSFHREVEKLLSQTEEELLKKRSRAVVIHLNYTTAGEVKSTLSRLFGSPKGNTFDLKGLRIAVDEVSNAVIVYGSEEELKTIKELISRLDRRKKQVLITATVVEASLQSVLDVGVNWQILGSNGGVAFGALSREALYQAISQGQFVVGAVSKSGTAVSVGGTAVFFPDLLFLYSLLEKGQGFNVISNPKVLTLDNQNATIKVGQEVPFPTGIKYDVNGNPIITYDYRYVGLELTVTPRISGNNLRLVVKLKLQEITGYVNNSVGGINYSVPITSSRELNSDLVVQNGQTIIIGGLIDTKTLESTSKVPLLGDVPLLGNLFKYKHSERKKTNLFIFITPFVISKPEELAKIMEEHKKLALKLYKLRKGKEVNDADLKRWLESINAIKPPPTR